MKHEVMGFEHLHLHTMHGSLLDGYGSCDEYAKRWKPHGDYLCVSDHGMMSAIPYQIRACDPSNDPDDCYRHKRLHPIYSCELYVNPLQIEYNSKEELKKYTDSLSEKDIKIFRKSYHLLAIAHSNIGYKNLVHLSSLAWLKGFYRYPRVNHEQLLKYKEGITFSSCCYASEIGKAFDSGGEDAAIAMVEKYMAMFGEHFVLEIMMLDFIKQKPYDKFIIKIADKYNLPIILSQDCHFSSPEDRKYQQIMIMIQLKKTFKDIEKAAEEEKDILISSDKQLWMKTEEELDSYWELEYSDIIDYDIYKQAKRKTVEICRKALGVRLDRSLKLPMFDNSDEKLKEEIAKGFSFRQLPKTSKYLDRIKEEFSLISEKGFSSYFLIDKMIVDEAREVYPSLAEWATAADAVGPGRGSAAGSLIYYLLGVTDADPIQRNLSFSRFLNPARGGRHYNLEFSLPALE
jgi:DNA polymerase-3 subunit alpha